MGGYCQLTMQQKKLIMKVWSTNNTKYITVPKDSDIEAGDYVEIIKIQ